MIVWVVWGVRLMVRVVGENERGRTWEKTEKLLNRESSLRNRGERRNAPPASTDPERTETLRTITILLTRKTTPINMSNSPPTLSHEPLLRGESPQQTLKRRRRPLRLMKPSSAQSHTVHTVHLYKSSRAVTSIEPTDEGAYRKTQRRC